MVTYFKMGSNNSFEFSEVMLFYKFFYLNASLPLGFQEIPKALGTSVEGNSTT